MNPLSRLIKRIDQELKELNRHRPFRSIVLERLREQMNLEMTYHSNAIEGNRLTLKETHLVLHEGITIKGKGLKDHLEAKNHSEAIQFLFEMVDQNRRISISNHLIRELHALVVKDTERNSGVFRKSDVQILGSSHEPPPGYQVAQRMDALIAWIKNREKKMHPIELAARVHHRFVHIHPFIDGNGRTGRLLMNIFLMRAGYPLAVILKQDRKKYYECLEMADREDDHPLIQLIAQSVERSLDIYLKAVFGTRNADEELLPFSKLEKKTSYSAKYLNLLARKGLLKARKKGRVWESSLKYVLEYQKSRLRKRS